ncbi:hypothetical protein BDF20DRAFT_802182, partial [Mycotypha africana]|uniref:uncharacterized protein n=1 Tax=Mycotypha africana TaxID=64632 RepID=UPI0023012480
KEKAGEAVNSAKSWLSRPMSSDWTSSLTQLESLSRVMFSPLAAHPVYKSESMMKALQLMQQQQQRNSSDPSSSSSSTSVISRALIMKPSKDYILQGKTYSWPSSTVLLQAEIPEQQHGPAVSLFQGFASTYPSLAKGSLIRTKKRRRNRK